MRRLSSDEPIYRSPASDTRATAVRTPPDAPSRRSPSAWDEPAGIATGEEAEPEPGILQEWYRYVDSLVRPARRLHEAEHERYEEEPPLADEGDAVERTGPVARPWSNSWAPPVPESVVDPEAAIEIVEQLVSADPAASRRTPHPEPAAPPPDVWGPWLPDLAIPELTEFIPTLEDAPTETAATEELIAYLAPPVPIIAPSSPAVPPAASPTALVPVPGSDREETPFVEPRRRKDLPPWPSAPGGSSGAFQFPRAGGGPPAQELPGIPEIREQWPRYAERLRGVPTTEVAQNSYKTQFKETRAELIERLLDPPLTLEETARLLGVCPTTVRRYTNRGWLAHYRTPGNQRRFRLSAVLSFLDEHGETSLVDEE